MPEEPPPRLDVAGARPLGVHVLYEGPLVGDALQELLRRRVAEFAGKVKALADELGACRGERHTNGVLI